MFLILPGIVETSSLGHGWIHENARIVLKHHTSLIWVLIECKECTTQQTDKGLWSPLLCWL